MSDANKGCIFESVDAHKHFFNMFLYIEFCVFDKRMHGLFMLNVIEIDTYLQQLNNKTFKASL